MKKLMVGASVVVLLSIGCKKNALQEAESNPGDSTDEQQVITRRTCGSYEVLQAQLAADPSLKNRMDAIEVFTGKVIAKPELYGRLVKGVIEIPVMVNVLYRTTAENISSGQIKSQITVLNEDFNNTNLDKKKVPSVFKSVDASIGIRFVLKQIVRKKTTKKNWGSDDAMKKSSKGGISPSDPAHNLNIWLCNLGKGLLGYAQFPGGSSSTDGVVILYSAFGSRAKYPSGTYIPDYDLGRTATHEVGHWVNLLHTWGDDGNHCSGSDHVSDTPNQGDENYGCPSFPNVSCNNSPKGDMFMNYMDYTHDGCMFMFTSGQKKRVRAVFASGGPRAAIGR